MVSNTGFAHLHVHTEHSALDGLSPLRAAIDKVAADKNTALAITDHGTLGGAWKFAKHARDAGIKPIIGIEAYIAISAEWEDTPSRHAPETREVERDDEASADLDENERGRAGAKTTKTSRYQHITLLAKNTVGWTNLTRMVNESSETYVGKYPLMDWELIKRFGTGIIALTGCLGGPVLGPMSRGNEAEAQLNLDRIVDAVGHDNVYVEIMEHGIPSESAALPLMHKLAVKNGLPLVATNDAHYVNAEDAHTHEAWLAVQSGSTLSDPKRFKFHGEGFHLRTEREMRELRGEEWWQTAVTNTIKVAERCDDVIPEPQMRLPEFPLPEGFNDIRSYYVSLVKEGAIKKFGNPLPEVVKERLNTELNVIAPAGFMSYFLIVHDVIKWARSQGIRVGPGRGSAAGSLTSYCLDIVAVDPLENNLLFERFLEPGRAGMPDIDVDFEQGRRHEVLQYLAQRWGSDRVARIGAFQASKTKRALRDASKLLEAGSVGDVLSKAVPIGDGGAPYTFDQLFDLDDPAGKRFRDLLATFGELGETVVDLARGFAGTVNGESIHACGTLIADTDLNSLVPLRKDRSKANSSGLNVVTQWDGKDIDDFGLLKLDVLGLRNLDIVSKAAQFIEQTTGTVVDPDNLPHPNTRGDKRVAATWELLRSGRTAGIFQMESSGMSNLAQLVQPERLSDLSAVVALYRPGPMSAGMHFMYADRKSGTQDVDYSIFTNDPAEQEAIASVLGETYGVFVYQEQLMRLGTVVSGFDVKMRSKLRKAVGKKIKSVMDEVGEAFILGAPIEVRDETGAITSPVFATQTAAKLFEYMKGSADYLFNASHSFAYAQLAYVTAYLKANWPAEYGAAILAVTDKDDKRQHALRALAEEGIEILAPDVNRSRAETFPIGPRTVLLGLGEIKGVGQAGADIAAFRAATDKPFGSIHDLITRVLSADGKSLVDVGTVEGLIEAGALDEYGPRLGMMRIARAAKLHDLPVPEDEWGVLERATRQRLRLGVIMGAHPLDVLLAQVSKWTIPMGRNVNERQTLGQGAQPLSALPEDDGSGTITYGILAEWSERAYKKGRMANFTIESSTVSIRGVLWNETLNALRNGPGIPNVGSIIALSGKVQVKSRDVEDEEGNVVETVVTKELMAFQVWTVGVDDGATAIKSVRTPSTLRRHLQLVVEAQPEPVVEIVKPKTAPPTTITIEPEVERVGDETVTRLPVVFRSEDGAWPVAWSSHPKHEMLADRVLTAAETLEPARKNANYGTFRFIEGKRATLLLVCVPSEYDDQTGPATWVESDTLPTWQELLGIDQPDRGELEEVDTPELAPVTDNLGSPAELVTDVDDTRWD